MTTAAPSPTGGPPAPGTVVAQSSCPSSSTMLCIIIYTGVNEKQFDRVRLMWISQLDADFGDSWVRRMGGRGHRRFQPADRD